MIISLLSITVSAAGTTDLTDAQAVALETKLVKFWSSNQAELPPVDDRLAKSPEKYIFKTENDADVKEYILLKSVNAKDGDGNFVIVNSYTDRSADTPYNTVEDNNVFDPTDTDSLAYKINQDSYIEKYFPLMKEYINTHTWYTEPTNTCSAYMADSKLALLSLTEYIENAERIGVVLGEKGQWWLRTPHNMGMYVWQFLSNKSVGASNSVTSVYELRYNRPCFYLSDEFFKSVKLDVASMGSEVKKLIKEKLTLAEAKELYSGRELRQIGFSVDDLMINHRYSSLNANKLSIVAAIDNSTNEKKTVALVVAAYDGDMLVACDVADDTLEIGEHNKVINAELDLSNYSGDKNLLEVKTFAFNSMSAIKPVADLGIDGKLSELTGTLSKSFEKADVKIPRSAGNIHNHADAYCDITIDYIGNEEKNYIISYTKDGWETKTDIPLTASPNQNIEYKLMLGRLPKGVYPDFEVKLTEEDGTEISSDKKAITLLDIHKSHPLDKFSRVGAGVNLTYRDYTEGYAEIMKALGFSGMRVSYPWSSAESEEGVYNALGSRAQKHIDEFAANGISISSLTAAYSNDLYNGMGDDNIHYPIFGYKPVTAYAKFAAYSPSMYRTSDNAFVDITRTELWNEPNLKTFWVDGDLTESETETKLWSWYEYSTLMNRAAFEIRKNNPDMIIAGGALAAANHMNVLEVLYDNGMLTYTDEYSFHPYMHPSNPDICDRSYKTESGTWDKYHSYVENLTKRYLVKAKEKGGWIDTSISEVGWPTWNCTTGQQIPATEEEQALYTVKALVYNDYLGIRHTEIFEARDRGVDDTYSEHNYGIMDYNNVLKPAAFVISQYNNANSASRYVGRVKLSDNVYGYVYQKGKSAHMIAWRADETGEVFEYTLPDGAAAEDMLGDEISGSTIQIGEEPVYVYNIPTSVVLQAVADFADIAENKKPMFEAAGFTAFENTVDVFSSFASLQDIPDSADKWLKYIDAIYEIGYALLDEKASKEITDEAFYQALYEMHNMAVRMTAVYSMYDQSGADSDTAVANAKALVLTKKGTEVQSSLKFADAIMRYVNRYNNRANEVSQMAEFEGRNGYAAAYDYLAAKLCGWAEKSAAIETSDKSRALFVYSNDYHITAAAGETITVEATFENLLDNTTVSGKIYLTDETGTKVGSGQNISAQAQKTATATLSGSIAADKTAGDYTFYINIEENGSIIKKAPIVITVQA